MWDGRGGDIPCLTIPSCFFHPNSNQIFALRGKMWKGTWICIALLPLVRIPLSKKCKAEVLDNISGWRCKIAASSVPSCSFDVKWTEIQTSNWEYGKCHSSAAFGPTYKTQRAQDLDMIWWWPLAVFRLAWHTSFIFVWCQTDRNSNIQSSIWKMPQLGTFWSYFQHTKITERRYDMPMMFGSVLARLPCFLHLRLMSNGPKFQHQMGNMENATARHLLILLPAHKNHRT